MTFPLKMRVLRVLRGLIGFVLLAVGATVHGDEIADIGKLLRGGQLDQASQRVDAFLAGKPRDAQGQFLKGLILTEQNKTADAIAAFTRLTELYPELPEPYNNLAVLYAGQGNYERARQALEMAIRTHPSYATAHENLGDVYAKLASQAYDKALQLDSNNPAAQTKLALVRDLIGGARPRAQVAQATPPASPAAKPGTVVAQAPSPVTKPTPAAPVTSAPAAKDVPKGPPPSVTPLATPPATPLATSPVAPAPAKEPPKTASEEGVVIAVLRAWAAAWSKQDVSGYLGAYAKDFKLPRGASRQTWEAARKQRIDAPKSIAVGVESIAVSFPAPDVALVKFRQNYKSNIVTANSSKTVVMTKSGGRWQIREERSGS